MALHGMSDKKSMPTPHLEFRSSAANVVSCGE